MAYSSEDIYVIRMYMLCFFLLISFLPVAIPAFGVVLAVFSISVLMFLMHYDSIHETFWEVVEEAMASDSAPIVGLSVPLIVGTCAVMFTKELACVASVGALLAFMAFIIVSCIDMSRRSFDPVCLMVWAVNRHPAAAIYGMMCTAVGIALGGTFVYAMISGKQSSSYHHNDRDRSSNSEESWNFFPAWLLWAVLGAWIGPMCSAYIEACTVVATSRSVDFWDAVYKALAQPTPVYMSPKNLRYSSRHILSRTRCRQVIQAPRKSYVIRAVFHEGYLFSLDNYTLYSARFNEVEEIPVLIVDKPTLFYQVLGSSYDGFLSWFDVEVVYEESPELARLQIDAHSRLPWGALKARATAARIDGTPMAAESHPQAGQASQAMRVPAEAFAQHEELPQGSVVLVVDRVVKFGETLVNLIQARHPGLEVQNPPEGRRSYASVRVSLAHEVTVREAIKALGRERGKRSVNIKAVPGTLVFNSPRD